MGFMGFPRPNGRSGIRNHVLVMSSVVCANGVASAIARAFPEVKLITHTEGCGRGPMDVMVAARTLIGVGKNPNVAAVLVVGLGCEFITKEILAGGIADSGIPVEMIGIQDEGGSVKAAKKGIGITEKLLAHAKSIERQECDWSTLTLGLKCGGSDALSGVTANPMVGAATDWLVAEGGRAILAETTEMIGTETILAERTEDQGTAARIVDLIRAQHQKAKDILGPMADLVISPGNMDGGLSSIREKSLGCVVKGGTTPIRELVDYAETPDKSGLVLMDTPGSDIFSISAMAAGGAQMILFTTGRGTPAGFPVVPVVKISSNSELFRKMEDDMDVNAGRIADGLSLKDAGEYLIGYIKSVADGKRTKAEINLNDLFAIHTNGPSF